MEDRESFDYSLENAYFPLDRARGAGEREKQSSLEGGTAASLPYDSRCQQ